VLVPRPDTETLVDWALETLAAPGMPTAAHVLDLGTGSGAIALALKKTRPALAVTAVDASADALAVALANARQQDLPVSFIQGSWLENVSGHFHLIVSNPPYVAEDDPHLTALAHEPLSALTAGYSRYSASGEINSTVDDQAGRMAAVKDAFASRNGVTTDELDGLTVELPGGGWFNIRPSNTEPLLRLNIEAADDAAVAAIRDEVLAIVRA